MKSARPLLLVAATALCIAGCSDPTSTVPEPGPGATLAASRGTPDLTRLATFRPPPSVTIAGAKKWIGPAGGRLDFHGFAIDVPAGAVDRVTQFSIRLPVDAKSSERVLAEFGPHQGFALPVTIELPYAGTSIEGSGATPAVLWWNSEVAAWEDMGGWVSADGARLATRTDHFSLYGTSTLDDSGGVTTSGGRIE